MMPFVVTFASLALASASPAQPALPMSVDLDAVRALAVQHDGRWPPLDTVARDIVETVTGDMFYEGHDPVLLLLAWTFDPQTWTQAPLITIRNAELRGELQLSASDTVFSYAHLLNHQPLRALINDLANIEEGRKPNPLESKVGDIESKLRLLQRVFRGQAIKPIPHPKNAGGPWRPIVIHDHQASEQHDLVEAAWTNLRDAFLADDGPAFAAAADGLVAALADVPAAYRPDLERLDVELRYNELNLFGIAWKVMVAGTILAVIAILARRTAFDCVALIPLIAGFAILSYGLSMRWQIAGRIPASNMYESLLFLSWGTGAFAIVSMFALRDRMVPMTASAMGALALMLADVLPMNHFIRPIAPVLLDTVWMSIHVPVIMVSYSVLALAVLVAHVQLVVMALAPQQRQLIHKIDTLHYWYVHVGAILLAAGIITGSMWAASSWGRYWGWDPKEVWSLVAFLGYLTILHVRTDRERMPWWGYAVAGLLTLALFYIVAPKLAPMTAMKAAALGSTVLAMVFFVVARGEFATGVKSILAFWMIIMTYLGVNYVLGSGLHSYGFGTGAMARYMFMIGGIDLLLVAALWVIQFVTTRIVGEQPVQRIPVAS